MSKLLTVFTPTYNRAYTLHLCYESLIRQTSRDFEWLIIDDGSTDETRELVAGWIKDNRIPIRYHYQENQGMHGAHNAAYERITTELNVCIDSDDYMTDDAVAKICAFWREHGGAQYAGLAGLDITRSGEVIGTRLPKGLKQAALTDLYVLHQVRGDKKLVYRTAVTAGVPPYPVYPGEKYVPLSYKYMLIDQQFPLLLMDEPLCVVEYLQDGSSLNMIKQYRANPRGFQFFRKVAMTYAPSWQRLLREAAHYVSSSLLLRNRRFLLESPRKGATLLALPAGVALYLYIQNTGRTAVPVRKH
jgi:glycosyltransferase involved in cell wall biosynthesis